MLVHAAPSESPAVRSRQLALLGPIEVRQMVPVRDVLGADEVLSVNRANKVRVKRSRDRVPVAVVEGEPPPRAPVEARLNVPVDARARGLV